MSNKVEKMTNRKALEYVLANCEVPADVQEKIESMIVALEKRSSAERKPSARQTANEKLKEQILNHMEVNRLYSIGEMLKEFDFFDADMSSQRVSALLGQLVDENKVVRTIDKRKSYFSLA